MTKEEYLEKYKIEPHKDIMRGNDIATAALVKCSKHKVVATEYGISYCKKCQDAFKNAPIKKKVTYEMVPQRIKDERKKYVKSTIQSHRQGELSKEFVENYPKKTKEWLDAGVITHEEVRKAKNVWGEIPNIENIKKTL